jgi:hypothetical protein
LSAEHRSSAKSQPNAEERTANADGDGFDQELKHNVYATGANRHAQADLAGTLRDRNQHDIHDADAADDQRNNRDGRDQ